MKKNIIIGVLSLLLIVMISFSYSQKTKAEKMAEIAKEMLQTCEMLRVAADLSMREAKMQREKVRDSANEALILAIKARVLAEKQETGK